MEKKIEHQKNPYQLWVYGGYQEKRTVLKLVFSERLTWNRKGLYRTTQVSIPFRFLDKFSENLEMVPGAGLEPARYCYRRILSPLRLPISPPGLTGA